MLTYFFRHLGFDTALPVDECLTGCLAGTCVG